MDNNRIDRAAIAEVYHVIRGHIRRTPTIDIGPGDLGLRQAGTITLKLEHLQHTGSFKARGAFANLLTSDIPPAGVAAASGGNHGAAIAYAAGKLGHAARIFVPDYASETKVERIRTYGAQVEKAGDRFADVLSACTAYVEETGARNVHAYDQRETLWGQGSIGLELETQSPNIETLLVAVGGGGLIGGIAAWYQERIGIVGVEPSTSCALFAALDADQPVDVDVSGLAADSLGAQRIGDLGFALARTFVERVALVDDDAIAAAQSLLWDRLRIVAEPGGATALAALIAGSYVPQSGERVCVLVCGGNTAAVDFSRSTVPP